MPVPYSMPALRISVQSNEMAVRSALSQLLDGLKPLKLEDEEASTVELVMAEALNNIVEHAYPEGGPSGPIDIACKHKADGLHITITDQGEGMPDGQTPVGMEQNLDVDVMDLPEGGFGWFLIKDLAKDVDYIRAGWENRLTLRLAVAMAAKNA